MKIDMNILETLIYADMYVAIEYFQIIRNVGNTIRRQWESGFKHGEVVWICYCQLNTPDLLHRDKIFPSLEGRYIQSSWGILNLD